ncbi:something about silencing protein 10 [Leptopilina boulardi]|uniref:something about silencing protein 10 n=1 Tax=Leptopilina boulardi TaxID=63433 RepID=UPI0021F638A3|nr:something about silencing protein 10 [Leptopilina boulardi]XP_051173516.1 something about silencing protein 10 [Leptopilina boulardi]
MIRYNRDDDDDPDMDDIEMSDDSSEKVSFSRKKTETVTEVLGFKSDDDDDEDDETQEVSMDNDEDIPNTRAWGKKKKTYYSTDYVDTDYATLNEKDEKRAKIEEEEAKIIQKRMAKELDDVDFSLNTITDEQTESKENISHVIKVDISKFSNRQKFELMEKESPEFLVLLQDIKEQLAEIKSTLNPYLKSMKAKNYSNNAAFQFIQKKYQTALHYCVNIIFYLTLKSKRLFFNSHPVIKRLAQYRQLLNQMNTIQEQVLQKAKKLLELSENEKSLKIEDGFVTSHVNRKQLEHLKSNDDLSEEEEGSDKEITEPLEDNIENSTERRLITYQIAKNKGLTPHRSKEQRNPRVKHRNKYRKAMIRRKGAVREVRRELKRYGGEMSGIKTGVKKSISLK